MTHFRVDIRILPKVGVRDPEGDQILQRLGAATGIDTVTDLVTGKFFRLVIVAEDEQAAADQVATICEKFLANPILNSYEVVISPAAQ